MDPGQQAAQRLVSLCIQFFLYIVSLLINSIIKKVFIDLNIVSLLFCLHCADRQRCCLKGGNKALDWSSQKLILFISLQSLIWGQCAKAIGFAALVASACCTEKKKHSLLGVRGIQFLRPDSGGCFGENVMTLLLRRWKEQQVVHTAKESNVL